MLFKVLSLFLVVQFAVFAVWQGVQAWHYSDSETVSKPAPIVEPHEAAITVSGKVEKMAGAKVRFAARSVDKNYQNLDAVKREEILKVIQKLPYEHTETLKHIVLDYDPKAHRGLGGKSLIILRAVDMTKEEFNGVLIHEIGHNADLGYLSETDKKMTSEFKDGNKIIYQGDPSLDFYRISWNNDEERKKSASNLDFVSGYALNDPFEDFAESYVYYVLHNKKFKSLTQTSPALLAKYQFMRDIVFEGKEYDTGEYITENLWRRPWDITVLSYNLGHFLNT